MDDSLLVALFKEIAVVHGKRSPDGQWTDANPWHVQNALEIAMRILKAANQSAGGSSDPAPAIQISKPSSPVVNAGATNRDTSLENAVRRPTKHDALSKLIKMGVPINSVLDVGVQYETRSLRVLFKNIKQLLIEPIVEYNDQMSKTYKNSGVDFEILNVAASNKSGTFFLETSSVGSTDKVTHARMTEKTAGPNVRAIPFQTLDEILAERDLPTPHLLKIDVDGAESSIIEGARRVLGVCSVVIVEAHVRNVVERTTMLVKSGFQLFDVCDLCYYDDRLSQVDLIFINTRKFGEYSMDRIAGRWDPAKWQELV